MRKIQIGEKRELIKKKIGNPNHSYISDAKVIIDIYYNDSQLDAPLVLSYNFNDSILIEKHIDW